MTSREAFQKLLPIYMKKANMNQTELAEAVGVSKSTVHCWLNGKAFPRIDVMQKTADVLGCDTDDLITIHEIPKLSLSSAGEIRRPFSAKTRRLFGVDSMPQPKFVVDADGKLRPRKFPETPEDSLSKKAPVSAGLKSDIASKLLKAIGVMAKDDPKAAAEVLSYLAERDMI